MRATLRYAVIRASYFRESLPDLLAHSQEFLTHRERRCVSGGEGLCLSWEQALSTCFWSQCTFLVKTHNVGHSFT